MRNFNNKINICLIGGTGRCGTTILKKIFQKHPDVANIPEWRFSIDPDGLIDFYNTFSTVWSPFLYDIKIKRLKKMLIDLGRDSSIFNLFRLGLKRVKLQQRFPFKLIPRYSDVTIKKVCPEYFELVDKLINNLIDFQYPGQWTGNKFLQKASFAYNSLIKKNQLAEILGNFFRNVIFCVLENQNKRHYVEDNTWNILWFDRLLELVPEARLIHIYRDPRDVVASFIKQDWAPADPINVAKFYRDIIHYWWNIRNRIPPDSYKEISLESLVSNTKSILQEICHFWNIPWHDSLLETDLSHAHSGRWEKDFNDPQKEQVNSILSEIIKQMGYME